MGNMAIAIDGPAGSGKSTVAKLVAKKLGYTYIDTGAMYRAVAWKALAQKKAITDELIISLMPDITVELRYNSGHMQVLVDGQDVSEEIRTPEVTAIVSQVARLAPVRAKMVALQRRMAEQGPVVMDGRDIATNVLPGAEIKIFLTASLAERASRRGRELKEKGYPVDLDALQQDMAERDKADSEREISPLRQAEDAVPIDTTGLTIDEVVSRILGLCR